MAEGTRVGEETASLADEREHAQLMNDRSSTVLVFTPVLVASGATEADVKIAQAQVASVGGTLLAVWRVDEQNIHNAVWGPLTCFAFPPACVFGLLLSPVAVPCVYCWSTSYAKNMRTILYFASVKGIHVQTNFQGCCNHNT